MILTSVIAAVGAFLQVAGYLQAVGFARLPFAINSNLAGAVGAGLFAAASDLEGNVLGTVGCTVVAVVYLGSWWNDRGHHVPAPQPIVAGRTS